MQDERNEKEKGKNGEKNEGKVTQKEGVECGGGGLQWSSVYVL